MSLLVGMRVVITKAVKLRLTCHGRHWVGDNIRMWAMHNLNLGKTHRIHLLMCTNPWGEGAILSSGLVRIDM